MSLRDRVIDFRRVPVADLAPHPKNWRKHPRHQQSALRGLLDEIGFAGAVLARQGSDRKLFLIDGHLRRDLLPNEEIPVLVTDLSEEEAEKLLATYDPIGAMATRDDETLRELLATITTQDDGLRRLLEDLGKASSPAGLAPRRRHAPSGDRHQGG